MIHFFDSISQGKWRCTKTLNTAAIMSKDFTTSLDVVTCEECRLLAALSRFSIFLLRLAETIEPAEKPVTCWRCGLGDCYVLEHPSPTHVDHDGVSHYACIAQSYNQMINIRETHTVDGPNGTKVEQTKIKKVPRPGARGISERWTSAQGA